MPTLLKLILAALRARFIRPAPADAPRLACERALLDFDTGNEKRALTALNTLLRQEPPPPPAILIPALRARVTLLCRAQMFKDALRDFDALLALPELETELRVGALLDKALALAQTGDQAGATAICETVIAAPESTPRHRQSAIHNLCLLKKECGDLPGALKILGDFLKTPGLPLETKTWALPMFKSFRYESGDTAGTIETLTEIIETPQLPDELLATSHFERGVLRGNDNLYRMAVLDFSAVLLFQGIPVQLKGQACFCRADALQQLGDKRAATLDRALAFSHSSVWHNCKRYARLAFFAAFLLSALARILPRK